MKPDDFSKERSPGGEPKVAAFLQYNFKEHWALSRRNRRTRLDPKLCSCLKDHLGTCEPEIPCVSNRYLNSKVVSVWGCCLVVWFTGRLPLCIETYIRKPFAFLYTFLSFLPKCPNWKVSTESECYTRINTKYNSTGNFPTGWLNRERDRLLTCCFSKSLTFQKKAVHRRFTGILYAENTCKSCFTFHQLSGIHCIKKRNCDLLLYTGHWWFSQTWNIQHMRPETIWGAITVAVEIHILSIQSKQSSTP